MVPSLSSSSSSSSSSVGAEGGAGLDHYYYKEAKVESSPAASKVVRLAQELGTLSKSLPLSMDSSIFVRVAEERMDLMKVLIIGPRDTPYACGCFAFDIYFPPEYPHVPPKVHLLTTGGGTVRFNPNLYKDGKVCLSLLGTWPGQEGEMWNSRTSTILQVMVSIQSLILVGEPYFNEPGYEQERGTPTGDQNNRLYNQQIREATLQHAILGQLRNPSPGVFGDVIRAHFYLQREPLLQMCRRWLEEAKTRNTHYQRMDRLLNQLQAELEAMPEPVLLAKYKLRNANTGLPQLSSGDDSDKISASSTSTSSSSAPPGLSSIGSSSSSSSGGAEAPDEDGGRPDDSATESDDDDVSDTDSAEYLTDDDEDANNC